MARRINNKELLAWLDKPPVCLPALCTTEELFEVMHYKDINRIRRVSRKGGWLHPARVDVEGSSSLRFDTQKVKEMIEAGKMTQPRRRKENRLDHAKRRPEYLKENRLGLDDISSISDRYYGKIDKQE